MTKTPAPTNPTPVSCFSSVTGAPVLESESIPTEAEAKAALLSYAIVRSDCMTTAARSLGVSPTRLRALCKIHKIKLPSAWSSKTGGR